MRTYRALASVVLLWVFVSPAWASRNPTVTLALTGGSAKEGRFTFETGAISGSIALQFDMFTIPDSLRIYYDEELLYDTGMISGSGKVAITYGPGTSTRLTIVFNEGVTQENSVWLCQGSISPDLSTNANKEGAAAQAEKAPSTGQRAEADHDAQGDGVPRVRQATDASSNLSVAVRHPTRRSRRRVCRAVAPGSSAR